MTYTNAAETIRVGAGANFAVRLASNPTTGYQWQLVDLGTDAPVRLLEHRFEEHAGARRRLGAGGHEIWLFEAVRPGAADLELKYLRPWAPDSVHTSCVFKVRIVPLCP